MSSRPILPAWAMPRRRNRWRSMGDAAFLFVVGAIASAVTFAVLVELFS